MASRSPRLVFVTTVPTTAYLLLRGQLAAMREAGFDVHIVSSPGEELFDAARREGVTPHALTIPRDVDPMADAVALARLVRVFRELRPDIVNASTPKAGFLGMLAARIARVPIRFYVLRGLRLETTDGGLLRVLGTTERIASRCAHQVVCVSPSLMKTYVERGFASNARCRVLEKGSSNGVDPSRFASTPAVREQAAALRNDWGIGQAARVIGFAGRMVVDKGIVPLLDAFETLCRADSDLHLMMVGDSLAGDRVRPDIRARVERLRRVHVLPRMENLAPFYAAIDVLAFPSFREGFPNVPVEAAAAGVPVVGFPSTGVVDAIEHGVTGTIVPRGAASLAAGLHAYLGNPELARLHGEAGRARVAKHFPPKRIWAAWIECYRTALEAKALPAALRPLR